MASQETCAGCGDQASEPLHIRFRGRQRIFCSFLCAIRSMAPVCAGCGDILLGKGAARDGQRRCGPRCAPPFLDYSSSNLNL